MNLDRYYLAEGEQPLDVIKPDGGFFSIFRTFACIGDSLASGEMESHNPNGTGYHDYFEYSWGQFMARAAGSQCYNFSRGGMTAIEYWKSFGEAKGFWDPEKAAQAYIFALGVNDVLNQNQEIGTVDDICPEDPEKNTDSFAGWYGRILTRYRQIAPKSRMFLMTMPRDAKDSEAIAKKKKDHADLLNAIAERNEFMYVIDLNRYAPVYDKKFRETFFMGGHLNAAGYRFTAEMTMSYIDYIIRKFPDDFTQTAFIGKDGSYHDAYKW